MVLISKTDFKFFSSISEMASFKGMTKGRRITTSLLKFLYFWSLWWREQLVNQSAVGPVSSCVDIIQSLHLLNVRQWIVCLMVL